MSALTCVVDRPDLATAALGGSDVLRYLHAVCTQHTLDLAPGDATQALLLSPKGKIEFAFRLAVLSEGVLVDTEAAAAPGLAERLARFVFRHDVTVGRPVQGHDPIGGRLQGVQGTGRRVHDPKLPFSFAVRIPLWLTGSTREGRWSSCQNRYGPVR